MSEEKVYILFTDLGAYQAHTYGVNLQVGEPLGFVWREMNRLEFNTEFFVNNNMPVVPELDIVNGPITFVPKPVRR